MPVVHVAKGPCPACGAPVVRRVATRGTHPVRCPSCAASFPLESVPVEVAAPGSPASLVAVGRPVPTAPPVAAIAPRDAVEPPTSPEAARGASRRSGKRIAIAMGVAAALGLAAFAAYTMLGPAAGDAATYLTALVAGEPDPSEWATYASRLVIEEGEGEVTFRFEWKAVTANGRALTRPPQNVSTWEFTTTDGLVAPGTLTGWSPCVAHECSYAVAKGRFAYVRSGSHVVALNTTTAELALERRGTWSGWTPWSEFQVTDVLVNVHALANGDETSGNRIWMLDVKIGENRIGDTRRFTLTVEQAGRVLLDEKASEGRSYWARAGAGPAKIVVHGPAGERYEGTFTPSDCRGGLRVELNAPVGGPIVLAKSTCT